MRSNTKTFPLAAGASEGTMSSGIDNVTVLTSANSRSREGMAMPELNHRKQTNRSGGWLSPLEGSRNRNFGVRVESASPRSVSESLIESMSLQFCGTWYNQISLLSFKRTATAM
jgi:hypothetical protein